MLYQLTPLPRNRLFAVANQKLAFSDDRSCGWRAVASAPGRARRSPTRSSIPWAARACWRSASRIRSTPVTSRPTGARRSRRRCPRRPRATPSTASRSPAADANVIYLAMTSPDGAPLLARSSDGGAHFEIRDLERGPRHRACCASSRSIPQDANRVLFRFLGANDQSIALTTDGGMTATKPVIVNGNFTSFVRLPTGTILVGGMVEFASCPGCSARAIAATTLRAAADVRPRSARCRSATASSTRPPTTSATATRWGRRWTKGRRGGRCCRTTRCRRSTRASRRVPGDLRSRGHAVAVARGGVHGGCRRRDRRGAGGGAGAGGTIGGGGVGGGGTGGPPPPPKKGGCDIAATPGAPPLGLVLLGLLLAQAWRRGAIREAGACGAGTRTRARTPRPRATR